MRHVRAVHEDDDPEVLVGVQPHKGREARPAAGGQILASTSTAGMVNSTQFDFGEPMTVELKGLSGTHQVVPINWSNQLN